MMKKSLIFGIFCFLLLSGIAQAQEVEIICDKDVYYPDIYGYIDIYCDITNPEHNTKNEKVGFIFDDYLNEEVQIIDVLEKLSTDSNWQSIKPNMNKDKPDYKRTRQLTQQNIQIKEGETVNLWMRVKVPFASSGKFDVLYGNYVLDPWWNSSWQYRQNFTVSYNGNYNLTDYQIKLALNETIFNYSNAKSDGSDLRILYNEDQYEMPICIKDWNNTGYSEIWTKMNLSVGQSINITVYYGNPSANSVSNCSNVFDFWEDWKGYANGTFLNETGKWKLYYTIWSGYTCDMPYVYKDANNTYLYWKAIHPYCFAYYLNNITTQNYSIVAKMFDKAGLVYGNRGFAIKQKSNNFPYGCFYQSDILYPCGVELLSDISNTVIIFTNSTHYIFLNVTSPPYLTSKIYELQIEGYNITGNIYDATTKQLHRNLKYYYPTPEILLEESQIILTSRWIEDYVYEVYVRKFTYNEPTVYPQAEMSYLEYQELLPKPYNFMKTLMGQALLITLGAGVIFLIMSLFIFEKIPLTIENAILIMVLLIVALGLITALA